MNNRNIRQGVVSSSALRGGGVTNCDIRHRSELFNELISTQNIFLAWDRFVKGKHSKSDVQAFARRLEDNLFDLQDQLRSGTYQHDPYHAFIIHDPKRRQIHKSTVKDRIVHQAITNVIEPFFERQFIYDSYSCRVGKGTHAAVRRLADCLDRLSRNNKENIWVLKCDIKKFFASVDHRLLFSLLGKKISDKTVLELLLLVINSFSVKSGKGIPLGNLTSQLFANVYLNELDQFVKHELRCQYYLRYCDDFVLLNQDRLVLEDYLSQLNVFLQDKLQLRLHERKVCFRKYSQGIDFLGYVVLPFGIVLRTKTKNRMLKRVNESNVSSYLGLCSHARAYSLEQTIKNKIYLK
ncbi:MAG: reverse transcriptase/maturase family protein [Candidatus Uhrbacteria bacterium]